MAFTSLKKFARRLFAPRPVSPIRTAPRRRLGVESLEDRLTPAANYWQPTTVDAVINGTNIYDWSDASNWSLGHAPQSTDDLHFANLSALTNNPSAYTSTDDMPNATVDGIYFDGIATISVGGSAVGYTIAEPSGTTNAITVGAGGITTRTQATYAAHSGDNTKLTVWVNPQVNFASGGTIQAGGDTSSSQVHATTDTLNFLGTVSNGNGGLTVQGVQTVSFANASALSGTGGLTVADSSLTSKPTLNVQLNGSWINAVGTNGVAATTTVNQGTLNLASTTGVAVPGALIIGTGQGLSGTSPVTAPEKGANAILTQSNQTATTSAVTVNSEGNLLFQNSPTIAVPDTIGPLTMNGGTINTHWAPSGSTGSTKIGTLTLNGNVTTNPNAQQATIVGAIDLGAGPSRVFNIGINYNAVTLNTTYQNVDSTTNADVDIQATISSINGDSQLIKQGAGFLQLDAANTYTASTDIQAGILWVSNGNAIQDSSTTVEVGAGLNAINPNSTWVTFACPLLTLNGPGDPNWTDSNGNEGALYASAVNYYGTVQWAGNINLASNSTIDTDWGTTLDITGQVADAPSASGQTLTAVGPGLLVLDDNNTYTGATVIAGEVMANHVNSLGATNAGAVTVNSGAALLLAGGNVFAPKILNLNGTGNNIDATDTANTAGGFSALQGLGTDPYGLGVSNNCLNTTNSYGTNYTPTTGTNTWTGQVVINGTVQIGATRGNTLQIGNSTNITDPSNGVISGTGTLQVNRSTLPSPTSSSSFVFDDLGYQQFNAPNSGGTYWSNSLGYNTGNVLLCGDNTYSGNTTVKAGMLTLANSNALGTGGTTTVNNNTTLRLSQANDSSAITISNQTLNMTGQGFYNYTASGGWAARQAALWNLSGINPNTWAGGVALQSLVSTLSTTDGTTSVNNGDSIGAASGTQLTITGNISTKNAQLGELDKVGTGTVQFSGDDSGYNGNTFLDAGTLIAATNTPFGASGNKTTTTVISAATLALSNATIAGGYLTLYGSGSSGQGGALYGLSGQDIWNGPNKSSSPVSYGVAAAGTGVTIGAATGVTLGIWSNLAVNAPLTVTGGGGVTLNDQMVGTSGINVGTSTPTIGSLTLNPTTGNGNYTGAITVNKGSTLLFSGSVPLSSPQTSPTLATNGSMTIASGGTLSLAPYYDYSIGGSLTNSGTLNLSGTLLVTHNYTQNSSGLLVIEYTPSSGQPSIGQLQVTGSATLSGSLQILGPVPVGTTVEVLKMTTASTPSGTFAPPSGWVAGPTIDPITGLPCLEFTYE
jgi:autotransporter-associated beta strand protein